MISYSHTYTSQKLSRQMSRVDFKCLGKSRDLFSEVMIDIVDVHYHEPFHIDLFKVGLTSEVGFDQVVEQA